MSRFLVLPLLLFSINAVAQKGILDNPPERPDLFANGLINTTMNERDIAVSPDGNEIFYSVFIPASRFHTIIHLSKNPHGKWNKPQVASFSGKFSDLEPAFSPDGNRLFFSSNRPRDTGATNDFDIWYVEKKNGQWVNPLNVGRPVNTSADEFYPSVTSNGNLYFTASYKNGIGKEDIFLARWTGQAYAEPVCLDSTVNTQFYEFNAFVSPDEKYILFSSFGRMNDTGRGDIYISRKDNKGNWAPARNCPLINSDRLDYCPFISFDKKILFFTSERHRVPERFLQQPVSYRQLQELHQEVMNGTGNVFWVSWDAVIRSLYP